jgi:ribosomal protection tetracycline resistance protein
VHGTPVPGERLRAQLAALARRGAVYPVLFGSAMTGAGTSELNAAITEFLPASAGKPDAPVDGAVFKIERGPADDKVAYVRLFAGTLRARDRVRFGAGAEAKVTTVSSADGEYGQARAGQIARVWGLRETRIGDRIRTADGEPDGSEQTAHYFAPPTLETAVVPDRRADRPVLHAALTRLAEQDPLINLRQGDQEIFISLYGEVQKEVIQATLADDFGIGVTFRETTTICVERPEGAGEAVQRMKAETNPFLASVGLRVEPAPEATGVEFRLGVELGAMPLAFFKTVEESVLQTLRQGIYGWQVTGCLVTMTHSGYAPRQSHAHATFDKSMSSTGADFRGLTPLVVMEALSRAGTAVFEPLHRFLLDIPAERSVVTLQALPRLDAAGLDAVTRGSSCLIEGEIPAARVRGLERELPTLTGGEGVLETAFERYRRVRGKIPARSRTGPNPLDREDYLIRVTRRV